MKRTYKPFNPKANAILIQGHYNNFIVNLKWKNQKYLFPVAHDFFFVSKGILVIFLCTKL